MKEASVFFRMRFGLYYVDFEDPARKRTIKKSGEYYRELISKHRLPERINEKVFAEDKQYAPRLNVEVADNKKFMFCLSTT